MQNKKKRKKSSPIKKAKNKLWKLVSEYIRKRDKGKCITCSKTGLSGSGYHAGHYIPSSTCGFDLRYNDYNIHGQCYHCNVNLGGFGAMYERQMVKRYGQEFVDDLWVIKNQPKTVKPSIEDYESLILKYQELLNNLKE